MFIFLQGAFHSTITSGLNFRQLLVANVFKMSKKRTISCGVPKFSKISSLKFSSIHFCSGKFQSFWLNGLHFRNLTVLKLSGNFPRKFLYHLAPFPNLQKFSSNGKCPESCMVLYIGMFSYLYFFFQITARCSILSHYLLLVYIF